MLTPALVKVKIIECQFRNSPVTLAYQNFVNKATSENLVNFFFWKSTLELETLSYSQILSFAPGIIVKNLKMTHAQPTQKCNRLL